MRRERTGKLPKPLRAFARSSKYDLLTTTRAINGVLGKSNSVTREAVRRWMR